MKWKNLNIVTDIGHGYVSVSCTNYELSLVDWWYLKFFLEFGTYFCTFRINSSNKGVNFDGLGKFKVWSQ